MKDYELLEKQAAMMRMAEKYGIDDWRKLVKVEVQTPNGDTRYETLVSKMYMSFSEAKPKFALGVVECRPVFRGDELWNDGILVKIKHKFNDVNNTGYNGLVYEYRNNRAAGSGNDDVKNFSWNPPKPKTISVEMLVDDAVWASENRSYFPYARISDACSKALKQIEQ